MLCLSLLHLEKGLIEDDQMDQLVDDYLNQFDDGCMPSKDNGDNQHNGNYSILRTSGWIHEVCTALAPKLPANCTSFAP